MLHPASASAARIGKSNIFMLISKVLSELLDLVPRLPQRAALRWRMLVDHARTLDGFGALGCADTHLDAVSY